MTDQQWTIRASSRLRSRRDPDVQARVVDEAARIIDLDRSVWPDEALDPYAIPLVQAILECVERCRAERLTRGGEHFAPGCRRRGAPALTVLPGGGIGEPREDAG